jgi:hypothetical protein
MCVDPRDGHSGTTKQQLASRTFCVSVAASDFLGDRTGPVRFAFGVEDRLASSSLLLIRLRRCAREPSCLRRSR